MASVLRSARRSTAGFFDFVGNTTNTAASLVRTAARSVEMLDAKAELMHDRVLTNCKLQRVNMTSEGLCCTNRVRVGLMTNLCRYRHLGGASSKHEADRYVLIMRGLIELAAHLPMSWSARHLLLAGVAIRAFIELAAGSSHRWRIVWQQRTSWRYGWSGLKDSTER